MVGVLFIGPDGEFVSVRVREMKAPAAGKREDRFDDLCACVLEIVLSAERASWAVNGTAWVVETRDMEKRCPPYPIIFTHRAVALINAMWVASSEWAGQSVAIPFWLALVYGGCGIYSSRHDPCLVAAELEKGQHADQH